MTTTIFHHATMLSMDEQDREYHWAQVRDGRIVRLGTGEQWREFHTEDTELVDLGGATVLPGFVEAHGHPTTEMSFLSPGVLDIRSSTCPTAHDVLDTLTNAVATADPEDWIVAFGWDPLLLPELPEISGQWLTEFSPTVPLSVMHYSVHLSWANQAALDRLGFTAETPDPVGSAYGRHEDGSLTGEAVEIPAALHLMGPGMQVSDERFESCLAERLEAMAAVGVTTTGDLAFEPEKEESVRHYFAHRRGPVRVRSYEITGARTPVARTQDTNPLYRQVGVKVWKDGSPWAGNIETSFSYQDSRATHTVGIPAGHVGCSNYSHEELLAICEAYYPLGWQIACHVHGDVAVDDVLDVIEKVSARHPSREYPQFRLEHAGAMTEPQVARAQELGVSISYFSAHVYYYGEVLDELFGERAASWVAANYAADRGMPFSLHNDPPVTAESPLLNIRTAVTRLTRSGRALGPEHGVSVREALRAQTIYPAQQLLSAHEVGSLEVGKFADFVVLSHNPLHCAPEKIHEIRVLQTWLAGTPTHTATDTIVHDAALAATPAGLTG